MCQSAIRADNTEQPIADIESFFHLFFREDLPKRNVRGRTATTVDVLARPTHKVLERMVALEVHERVVSATLRADPHTVCDMVTVDPT